MRGRHGSVVSRLRGQESNFDSRRAAWQAEENGLAMGKDAATHMLATAKLTEQRHATKTEAVSYTHLTLPTNREV